MLPIIGMSPGNSYFKDKEVAYLLRETLKRYGKAVVMVADVPAVNTYLAMGYSPIKAERKARLKGNALKNRTKRILEEMGIDTDMITIMDRGLEVETSEIYIQKFLDINSLYKQNKLFHDDVFSTSKEVLVGAEKELTTESVEQATGYLLAELAFIQSLPELLNIDEVTYVYHKPRKVYEQRIAGKYDGMPKLQLNFTLLEHPTETVVTDNKNIFKDRREVIKRRGSVRAVLFPYLDQVYFDAKTNEWKGWCVDIVREIFRDHEINLEILGEVGYGMIGTVFDRNEADIFISPIWPYDTRRLEVFHTSSYDKAEIYAILPINSPFRDLSLLQISKLNYLRVAAKENDIHHYLAQQLLPNAKVSYIPQLAPIEDVIHKIANDEADITFRDPGLIEKVKGLPSVDAFITKSIVRNSPIVTTDVSFAVPWGEFDLKKIIDDGIKKYIGEYLKK